MDEEKGAETLPFLDQGDAQPTTIKIIALRDEVIQRLIDGTKSRIVSEAGVLARAQFVREMIRDAFRAHEALILAPYEAARQRKEAAMKRNRRK